MPCSPSFVEHALDLLSGAGPVQARRMFGGHGLFLGGAMFGLLDDDELFLKTDAQSRAPFVEVGCRMWTYGDMTSTSYFRPPDEAHEDPEAMLPWARLAVETMRRALAAKAAKAARAAARRTAAEARKKAPRAKPATKERARPAKGAAKKGPAKRSARR